MKVTKFGSLSMVNGQLYIDGFDFDAEGAAAPYSSSDLLKAISDYLTSEEGEVVMFDENLNLIE